MVAVVTISGLQSKISECAERIMNSGSTHWISKHTSQFSFNKSHSTQNITFTLLYIFFHLAKENLAQLAQNLYFSRKKSRTA